MTRFVRLSWIVPLLCAPGLWGCAAPVESLPDPDIWVVDLISMGGLIALGTPVNVTEHDGYDNQPAFLADGERLVYSSRRGNQVDLFVLGLTDGSLQRLAATLESEYSPAVAPDGRSITTVRVERDGRQRVWSFPLEGGTPYLLIPGADYVAYYVWIDANTIAFTVIGEASTLQVIDLGTGEIRVLRENVGRSLHSIPGRRAIVYVERSPTGAASIREWDLDGDIDHSLARTVGSGQDFVYTPDGQLMMAQGTELMVLTPGVDDTWSLLVDFQSAGLGPISRIAVSPAGDRLALVAPAL